MQILFQIIPFCFLLYIDILTSANNLDKDLERISEWATQWKTNFNPGTTIQAQEVIFSHVHPLLLFNNANVTRTSSQKHLEIILDTQLKFCRPSKNGVWKN